MFSISSTWHGPCTTKLTDTLFGAEPMEFPAETTPTDLIRTRRRFRPICDEKRCHPRVIIDLPVQLTLSDGTRFNGTVHDVSPDALQIRCNPATPLIVESAERENIVDIRLHLPFHAGALNFSAQCRIVHQTVAADGQVAYGLHFKKFSR